MCRFGIPVFLERMDGLIPWRRLEERIRPVFKGGPYPLAVMLRVHCVQPSVVPWCWIGFPTHVVEFQGSGIVDASIIEAPSSTKNRTRERDPEMHQTKKGNQWHFGMKAHIGVDSSLSTTAANAHDVTEAHNLLHGGERVVWCDAGYQGVHKRWENLGLEIDWQVAT